MTPDEIQVHVTEAARLGYRLIVRHQPAVELEEPDWIVVVRAPDGRTLYPGAVDNNELDAHRRAAVRVKQDVAARSAVDA